MLCVFLRRCFSGSPPNCFGVFFTVPLFLGFLSEGFLGRTLAQEWGGGESWFFVRKIFPEICSILGDLVKKVGWVMAKLPRN